MSSLIGDPITTDKMHTHMNDIKLTQESVYIHIYTILELYAMYVYVIM